MTTTDWLETGVALLLVAATVFAVWFASGIIGVVMERWRR